MVTNREYFTIELTSEIMLAISLNEMSTVVQFAADNVCTVPGVADFWHGVANFKGSLLWILDSDRFFEIEDRPRKPKSKLTAVIIKNKELGEQKRVAITAQRLCGIMTLEASSFKPKSTEISSQLAQCCAAVAQNEAQTIYIVDSAALLKQLNQQSVLVST